MRALTKLLESDAAIAAPQPLSSRLALGATEEIPAGVGSVEKDRMFRARARAPKAKHHKPPGAAPVTFAVSHGGGNGGGDVVASCRPAPGNGTGKRPRPLKTTEEEEEAEAASPASGEKRVTERKTSFPLHAIFDRSRDCNVFYETIFSQGSLVPKRMQFNILYYCSEMYEILSNRLYRACGGRQTELRRAIHFEVTLEFYTAQYIRTL